VSPNERDPWPLGYPPGGLFLVPRAERPAERPNARRAAARYRSGGCIYVELHGLQQLRGLIRGHITSYYLSSTPSEGLREMRRACQIGDELMLDGHHTALILQICDRNTIQNIGNKVVCTFRPAQGS
jgi:hypothetical protein